MREEHIKKMHEQAKQSFAYALKERADYREPWRIFRIMAELVEGYQFLQQFKNEVTIFGSARTPENDLFYKEAVALGTLLAKGGFTTITGGGPGIMEAANRGAHEAGGMSVGLNIDLPFEQVINPHVKKSTSFNYFFTRKVMLTSPANAFVFFPGGYGTMDEFFEVVDLMELGFITKVPIVLVGRAYWEPLLHILQKDCSVAQVNNETTQEWHIVDTAKEAYEFIKDVEDVSRSCSLSPNNFHCEGNIDWKIFRVMSELVEGFEFLTGVDNGVTILGTKSIQPDSAYYHAAYIAGSLLTQDGKTVITGGKHGIAEAANKGAFEQGGESLGIAMNGPGNKEMNAFLTRSITFDFPFTRKLIVTSPSKGFLVFPGGFGTMHQFFEVLTLMQTKKMPRIPIFLYDQGFWGPLEQYIRTIFIEQFQTISKDDDTYFNIVDGTKGLEKMCEQF